MLQLGQELEVLVEKVVFGALGLIRYEGWVIFVEDVLPGETILIKISKKKKSFYIADLLKVIKASPSRIASRCPHFGTCGGCQLQHVGYIEQVGFKKSWIQESLKRCLSDKECLVTPAASYWEYRRKITMNAVWKKNSFMLGYYQKDNITLFEPIVCPIFVAENNPIITKVRDLLSTLSLKETHARVSILHVDHLYSLHMHVEKTLTRQETLEIQATLNKADFLKRSVVTSSTNRLEVGDSLFFELDGFKLQYAQDAFLQAHPSQSAQIYKDIQKIAREIVGGSGRSENCIFDLYCGIGALSLLLARDGFSVYGVEVSKEAINLAQENAKLNTISSCTFTASPVESWLKATKAKASLWCVNPPRVGLSSDVLEQIIKKLPNHLIYVSCMPTTLARDVEKLVQKGYVVTHVQGYDMFPQTTHVETLMWLSRK